MIRIQASLPKLYILLILFSVCFTNSYSQKKRPLKQLLTNVLNAPAIKYDTAYIHQFTLRLLVRPFVAYRDFSFSVLPKALSASNDMDIRYRKSRNYYVGIGGALYNTQAQLFFSLPDGNRSNKATSKHRDINLSLRTNRICGLLQIKQFGGLYTINGSDNTIQRNDISLTKMGGELFYVFNKNFSTAAIYKHSQAQQKSKGSMLLRFDISYLKIESDSSLFINNTQKNYYSIIDHPLRMETSGFNVQVGYVYSFSFAKWFYISPAAFAGVGPQMTGYDGGSKHFSANYSLNYRLFTGYTSPRFLCGIIIDNQYNYVPVQSVRYKTVSHFVKLTAGLRFW